MKSNVYLLSVVNLLFSLVCYSKPLLVGSVAPDFTLKDETGNDWSLHDFVGNKIVLYFYPKDDTPGCTKEACSIRNSYDVFEKNKIMIVGISYDSVESHREFKAKHRLPFTLLSDDNKKVAKLYGAASTWLWFFSAPIPSRITFLIDETGIIKAVIPEVNVTNHASEVLEKFGIKV